MRVADIGLNTVHLQISNTKITPYKQVPFKGYIFHKFSTL